MRDDLDDLAAHGDDERKRKRENAMFPPRAVTPADAVPCNWLDPLLSGPDAVLKGAGPWGCPDIERLLRAIRERVTALTPCPEELPRAPTMAMREAGRQVHHEQEMEAATGRPRMRYDLVTEIWHAMYDAGIQERHPPQEQR